MGAASLRPAVGEALGFERLILLSPVEDEHTNQVLDSMGGISATTVCADMGGLSRR
jgi:hypothetical protein